MLGMKFLSKLLECVLRATCGECSNNQLVGGRGEMRRGGGRRRLLCVLAYSCMLCCSSVLHTIKEPHHCCFMRMLGAGDDYFRWEIASQAPYLPSAVPGLNALSMECTPALLIVGNNLQAVA